MLVDVPGIDHDDDVILFQVTDDPWVLDRGRLVPHGEEVRHVESLWRWWFHRHQISSTKPPGLAGLHDNILHRFWVNLHER